MFDVEGLRGTRAAMRYRLAEQTIGRDDLQELVEWLQTDPWLTEGPLVREFEAAWARWLGVRHAVFVNSGSSANLLMYYAMHVTRRLEQSRVVVPSICWATTISPALQLGLHPIMCDADPLTFGLDLVHLEAILSKDGPAMVVVVHVLGVPNDMERLLELKQRFGFALLEDSCAATGSRSSGRLVGTYGEMSAFSFHYGHHLSTIEGGMVCTNDGDLYETLLLLRSHGSPKSLSTEGEERRAVAHDRLDFNRRFTFYHPGFNCRSTDLSARIGLSQMRKLDYVVARRVENHLIYQSRFAGTSFRCQRNDEAVISSVAFGVLAGSARHRDEVVETLDRLGIETRSIGGGNMSRQPFWPREYGTVDLPVADRIHNTGFQLPNHPRLTGNDIDNICDAVLAGTR